MNIREIKQKQKEEEEDKKTREFYLDLQAEYSHLRMTILNLENGIIALIGEEETPLIVKDVLELLKHTPMDKYEISTHYNLKGNGKKTLFRRLNKLLQEGLIQVIDNEKYVYNFNYLHTKLKRLETRPWPSKPLFKNGKMRV